MTTQTHIELATQYRPEDTEPAIFEEWRRSGAFHAEPDGDGDPYSIVIPPPNVTAPLHLGHALNNTLQDILIRWRRMVGDNALWMPGTDHAGIATQTVVEKRLMLEGKQRTDFPREDFIGLVQDWKDEYEQVITEQLKKMGCSCDWDRQRFTMDDMCASAVLEAFFRLFADGLIYRGKRLVNWDPVSQTALADDEVEMREVDGNFYYLRYPLIGPPLADGSNHITVATTRPETMLGDTAVAIHPADPYAPELRGRFVLLPIVNRELPIIEDEYVTPSDPDSDDPKARYSSGFLKVTPAHDPNDWEIGQRHGLDVINVMGPDATISRDHGWPAEDWARDMNEAEFLLGQSREAARQSVIRFFKDHQMLDEIKPYRHAVGHSYRSHVPIEPYLSDQWYLKVTDDRLRGVALRAIAPEQRTPSDDPALRPPEPGAGTGPGEGQLRFHPERYAKTYQSWLENLRDWCISRQLWWGHRIPVWVGPATKIGSAELQMQVEGRIAMQRYEDLAYVCVRHDCDREIIRSLEKNGFEQDPDVLDTWFSSALWPLSTMGWPQVSENKILATWNPTNVLCTAREIITLWVVRMVQFNLYFMDRLPFGDVFVHAMIQDGFGQKMSKSLGNGVDPMDLIHSHGADAMRFTLAEMTTHTQDVRMPVDIIDPHSGELIHPKFVRTNSGHRVAAPVQEHRGRSCVTSYGVATGETRPSKERPLARNTSERFDRGQRFANKLWNASRFALVHLAESSRHEKTPATSSATESLADHWILSRLAHTVQQTQQNLSRYEFSVYTQGLYDFFWRDLCDWYIEAIKPTVSSNESQRGVLAVCIDVSLRLLHPVMPFVTERLWKTLNDIWPQRQHPGIIIPPSEQLITASWPQANTALIDSGAERDFEQIQLLIVALRKVRITHEIPPRRRLNITIKAPSEIAPSLLKTQSLITTLANTDINGIGPIQNRPTDATVSLVGPIELYIHGLVDTTKQRLDHAKRAQELHKQIASLQKRLTNKSYVNKAPAHLVQETRDQLSKAQRELQQLGVLDPPTKDGSQ